MKNENIKNKLNWSMAGHIASDGFICKLPVKMVFMDDITGKGWKDTFKTLFKSLYTLYKSGNWWSERQFNVGVSYLIGLGKITHWFIDNAHRLNHSKEFRIQWIGRENYIKKMAIMLDIVNEGLVSDKTVQTYEFPAIEYFSAFGYNACQVMGAGYEFRALEKEFPIPFEKFKEIQLLSKEMFHASMSMEHAYSKNKENEQNKWWTN